MEQTIGKYKVLREIGKGGMGIVYKVMDPSGNKTLAVKVLPATMVDRSSVERFNREAYAMSRLRHPNLIEIYDTGMTGGQHYYSMEYIEGDTLKAMIAHQGPLDVCACLEISRQVSSALAYVHSQGMIHRDVKPGNIMVAVDAKIKLMDFGLVHIAGATRITIEGASVGTAEYMSPEQIAEEAVDSRSDIYSLGATMYEMLTGAPPFEAESFQAILMKHKSETPAPLREKRKDIPQEVERIVFKALAKDVSQRYQKIDELLDDIKRISCARGTSPVERATTTQILKPLKGPQAEVARNWRKAFKSAGAFSIWIIIVGGLVFGGFQNKKVIQRYVSQIFTGRRISSRVVGTDANFDNLELAQVHFSQGEALHEQGLYPEAVAEYLWAIRLKKDDALYYRGMARAYGQMGDKKKELRVWQDMLKFAPGSPYEVEALEQVERLK